MYSKYPNISAYVLAGGKSSRMGADKGLVLFREKPMVQYVLDVLDANFTKTTIISPNQDYEQFGYEVIADIIPDIGPAGGIYTALKHTSTKKIFIISCDMPFITSKVVSFLVKNSRSAQICLSLSDDYIQPLPGVYSTECAEKWEELVKQGNYKLRDLVTHFRLKTIETKNMFGLSDVLFMNINDKQQLEHALNLHIDEN